MPRKKQAKRKIRPLKRYCDCGNKITNHHKLCNKCWNRKSHKMYEKKKQYLLAKKRNAKKGIQISGVKKPWEISKSKN